MTDLRKAAEQALDFMDWLCGDDNSDRPKYTALNLESFLLLARTELRQALAEDALKTVADIDHSIGLFVDSPSVDAVNISQGRVDETAKDEHEPAVTWDASAPLVLDCPRCGHCCQQRQWVGFTENEKNELVDAFYGTDIQLLEVVEAKLKERNGG